jgi:hypothetical protein
MFETSGLLGSTTKKVRLRGTSELTLAVFKDEVNHGNKEHIRKLTTGTAGYCGAHAATPRNAIPCPTKSDANCEDIPLFHCWSHGLSTHANHTSLTCNNKKAGNITSATLLHQQGGAYFRIPHHTTNWTTYHAFYLPGYSSPNYLRGIPY